MRSCGTGVGAGDGVIVGLGSNGLSTTFFRAGCFFLGIGSGFLRGAGLAGWELSLFGSGGGVGVSATGSGETVSIFGAAFCARYDVSPPNLTDMAPPSIKILSLLPDDDMAASTPI